MSLVLPLVLAETNACRVVYDYNRWHASAICVTCGKRTELALHFVRKIAPQHGEPHQYREPIPVCEESVWQYTPTMVLNYAP